MRIRALVCAAMFALLVSLPGSTAAQDSGPTERVARLIRDLGSPAFEDRQRANEELAGLGAASREQLKVAANSEDAEVRARARDLLRRLDVERLWAASPVAIKTTDTPLQEILRTIADSTGNHLTTGSRYEVFNDKRLALDYESAGYWQLLDEICRASDNHLRPHYDVREAGVVVTAGRPGQNPVAYSGPLRLEMAGCRRLYDDELSYKDMGLKRNHSFKLSLYALWEDRLRLTAYRATPKVVVAATDDRRQLLPVEAIDTWNVIGANTRQLSLELKLQPPALDTRTLATLLLEWSLLAVGDFASLELTELAPGARAGQDGIEVVIESCSPKSETLCEIVFAVSYDELLPEPAESVFHENRYGLRDAQGAEWTLVDQAHDLRGELVRSKLTFRRESNDPASQPKTLSVHYPRVRSQRDLTIQFRDVPLPAPIDEM